MPNAVSGEVINIAKAHESAVSILSCEGTLQAIRPEHRIHSFRLRIVARVFALRPRNISRMPVKLLLIIP